MSFTGGDNIARLTIKSVNGELNLITIITFVTIQIFVEAFYLFADINRLKTFSQQLRCGFSIYLNSHPHEI